MKKKILMIYPEFPDTYWGFKHSLKFVGKKTNFPPLGLLTVAALLPAGYEIKLVDMNIEKLKDKDIAAADLVFISAMIVQKDSLEKVVRRCKSFGRKIVVGGPYATSSYQNIEEVDYFVLNEAEITLPAFLKDLEEGQAKHVYESSEKPDISRTPLPRFDLIRFNQYASVALQFSRGCPFNCEFCDIIELFGRIPRAKSSRQFIAELDSLYRLGYRGSVFIVDDNFIGNKAKVKSMLVELIEWQKERDYPFHFMTEASINLATDEELMDLMVGAFFLMVFVGVETPLDESLKFANKEQNRKLDLLESIRRIQKKGMEVTAGFILGFDSDPENIAQLQIDFIQKSGIPTAMVGLLTALPNTQLYRRLKAENRILQESNGNNTHEIELNFVTKMDKDKLISAYKDVMTAIYSPANYFKRCWTLLQNLPVNMRYSVGSSKVSDIFKNGLAFLRSLYKQIFSPFGFHYLRFLIRTLVTFPKLFPMAVEKAIYGYHFFKITNQEIVRKSFLLNYFNQSLVKIVRNMQEKMDKLTGLKPVYALKEFLDIKKSVILKIMKTSKSIKGLNQTIVQMIKQVESWSEIYMLNINIYINEKIEELDKKKAREFLLKFIRSQKKMALHLKKKQKVLSREMREVFNQLQKTIESQCLELEILLFKRIGRTV